MVQVLHETGEITHFPLSVTAFRYTENLLLSQGAGLSVLTGLKPRKFSLRSIV